MKRKKKNAEKTEPRELRDQITRNAILEEERVRLYLSALLYAQNSDSCKNTLERLALDDSEANHHAVLMAEARREHAGVHLELQASDFDRAFWDSLGKPQ